MMPSYTPQTLTSFLTQEILSRSKTNQLFIIGVCGLDASGKSQIAQSLAQKLEEEGKTILSLSGDSFQFPRQYKEDLKEKNWAYQHFLRTINFEKMKNELFLPLRKLPESIFLDIVDYNSQRAVHKKVSLHYPLIVIIESIYLFQQSLINFFDFTLFLDISTQEALKRAQSRQRDLQLYGSAENVEKKYSTKNFPGYELFLHLENPKKNVDIIIDNTDWKHPTIIRNTFK